MARVYDVIRPTVILAALTVAVTPLAAQQPAAPAPGPASSRLAWVNFQQVVANMPGFASAESTLTAELASARNRVQLLQVQLDSMVRTYDQQQIALSASARQQREEELRDTQFRFQQEAEALEQSYTQRERELIGPLEQRARAVIEGIRAERNLTFVFDVSAPGSNIITADRTLDITPVAIQRLNTPTQ